MDLGAFVQENKRWLLGIALGAVVYLVASAVIASVYDPAASRLSINKAGGGSTALYGREALAAARAEGEQLAAERRRLQAELAFVPSAKYRLDGQGAPDEYLFQVGRALKQGILVAADERDVHVTEKDVWWDVPTGVDDIRAVLFGLELLDETSQRLFAAHDAVRAQNPEAMGLRAILSLKLDARRARSSARPKASGEVDMRDLVVQEQVTFQFQADEATQFAFLEACRKPDRTLVVQSWTIVQPTRSGEPCTVKGTLQGIAFKEAK
jgi:hypothetical protein